MKNLLISILKGCYLYTTASDDLLIKSLTQMTCGRVKFELISKTDTERVFSADSAKITFTMGSNGYINDITVK